MSPCSEALVQAASNGREHPVVMAEAFIAAVVRGGNSNIDNIVFGIVIIDGKKVDLAAVAGAWELFFTHTF
jgi:hypothetical protein